MTPDQLSSLSFGYLFGSDLIMWCPTQFLISRYNVDNGSLQEGVATAYSEVINQLATKYDIVGTLQMVSGPREPTLVKILAIMSVRNILGNMQNIGEKMQKDFDWADKTLLAIRNGQMNLILSAAAFPMRSGSFLVGAKFGTIG
jgi:hypothetical protein